MKWGFWRRRKVTTELSGDDFEDADFDRLLAITLDHPVREYGQFLHRGMKLLEEAEGRTSAIHFLTMVISSKDPSEGLDRATQYLDHVIEQLEAKVAEEKRLKGDCL